MNKSLYNLILHRKKLLIIFCFITLSIIVSSCTSTDIGKPIECKIFVNEKNKNCSSDDNVLSICRNGSCSCSTGIGTCSYNCGVDKEATKKWKEQKIISK
ncbi:MAG: hypothetical protein ACRCSK_03750 [Fusobacteriaceae bacterium]